MWRTYLFRIGAYVSLDPPPVSNHFSEDTDDFIRRIGRLSDEESGTSST